jgi:hypothetical protein
MQGFLPILPLFLPLCSFFLTLKLLIYQAFRFIQQPLIIPAFFTFGLATPALASRGKGYAKCFTTGTQATIRQDQKDGQCGNEPEVYYGLCCLGIIGAGLAHENK